MQKYTFVYSCIFCLLHLTHYMRNMRTRGHSVYEVFSDAKYQRCTIRFYRYIFSLVPCSKMKVVTKMLKAIHVQESKADSREKAKAAIPTLHEMNLDKAAKNMVDGIEEMLTYADLPFEHLSRIRTNNH